MAQLDSAEEDQEKYRDMIQRVAGTAFLGAFFVAVLGFFLSLLTAVGVG